MPPVVAILQLDGVNRQLVERLVAAGRLPTLAELSRRGRWLALETPATHLEAAVSATVYSGLSVGQHGHYYPFQWSSHEQRIRYFDHLPMPETLWERLSTMGRRSLVIDPYECGPPRIMSGVCLMGWQLTNRLVLRSWSAPPGEFRRLSRRYGRPPAADEVLGHPSLTWLRSLRARLDPAPSRAADAAVDCLRRERFDLVWITFPASHIAGHWFWDPAQLDFPPAVQEELETALTEAYVALDAALGRVVAALPSGADLLVVAPSGMGVNNSRADLLPGMLAAVLSDGPAGRDPGRAAGPNLASRVRSAVPPTVRDLVAKALPVRLAIEITTRLEQPRLDWGRTLAFALPTERDGYVRLNVRGRERDGIVDPSEVHPLLERIAAGLLTFRDPDGHPTVAGVDRSPALFPGPRDSWLPDLVVRWSQRPARRLGGVTSPRHGEVRRPGAAVWRPGMHTDDAWSLIAPGTARPRTPSRPPHVVDVPATAMALLGGETKDLAGEPLLEA